MIIYLCGSPLIRSTRFENSSGLTDKRFGPEVASARGYYIYTWNSKDLLTGLEDDIPLGENDSINVSLKKINPEFDKEGLGHNDFLYHGLGNPNHEIALESHNSFIPIYEKSMMDLVRQLEFRNIDCLLVGLCAPVISNRKYASRSLRKLLKNPVKEIEL